MKWIIIFAILFSVILGEIARISLSSGIAFSLLDIALCINFPFAIFLLLKKRFINTGVLLAIVAFLFLCIISLIANLFAYPFLDLAVGSLYLIRFILFIALYITVSSLGKGDSKKLTYIMFLSSLIIAVGGFLQYFFYPNLQNLYYLGWDKHYYRLFSSFLDPNFTGVFLVLGFLLGLYLLIKNSSHRIVIISANAFILLAIFLTFSRSAFLGLLFGLISLFFVSNKQKKVIFFAGMALIIGIIVISLNYRFNEGAKLYRIASSEARLDSVKQALTIFTKNPFFGSGFNTYRYASHKYGFLTGTNWETDHAGAGVENSFLFILATTGLFGFGAFIFLITILLSTLYKKAKKNFFAAIALSSFICILVSSLFINAFFFPEIAVWMWTMLGITENE